MFISSPLIRGGGWGLGGVGKSLLEPLLAAPSPTARPRRQQRSRPPVWATLTAMDCGIGCWQDLVRRLTAPNCVPGPWDTAGNRRCPGWTHEVGMAFPPSLGCSGRAAPLSPSPGADGWTRAVNIQHAPPFLHLLPSAQLCPPFLFLPPT